MMGTSKHARCAWKKTRGISAKENRGDDAGAAAPRAGAEEVGHPEREPAKTIAGKR